MQYEENEVAIATDAEIEEIKKRIKDLKWQIQRCQEEVQQFKDENDEYISAYDQLVSKTRRIKEDIEKSIIDVRERSKKFPIHLKFSNTYVEGITQILKGDKSQLVIEGLEKASSAIKEKIDENDIDMKKCEKQIYWMEQEIFKLEARISQMGGTK